MALSDLIVRRHSAAKKKPLPEGRARSKSDDNAIPGSRSLKPKKSRFASTTTCSPKYVPAARIWKSFADLARIAERIARTQWGKTPNEFERDACRLGATRVIETFLQEERFAVCDFAVCEPALAKLPKSRV